MTDSGPRRPPPTDIEIIAEALSRTLAVLRTVFGEEKFARHEIALSIALGTHAGLIIEGFDRRSMAPKREFDARDAEDGRIG